MLESAYSQQIGLARGLLQFHIVCPSSDSFPSYLLGICAIHRAQAAFNFSISDQVTVPIKKQAEVPAWDRSRGRVQDRMDSPLHGHLTP